MPDRTCTMQGCKTRTYRGTLCSKHYDRWRKYGDPHFVNHEKSNVDEFIRLSQLVTDECVISPGKPTTRGYGRVQIDGTQRLTHRLALVMFTGIDPRGLVAAHGPCHNTMCMNARGGHVTWKTHAENTADRERDGTRVIGSDHPSSKLTPADVKEIRMRIAQGETQGSIGADFGITQASVSAINVGKSWGWLDR